jgi:hypothetical protein
MFPSAALADSSAHAANRPVRLPRRLVSEPTDDRAMVEAVRAGDEVAFAGLVRAHQAAMLGLEGTSYPRGKSRKKLCRTRGSLSFAACRTSKGARRFGLESFRS